MPVRTRVKGTLVIGHRTLLAMTCRSCGKFKGGKSFRKTKNGLRYDCSTCVNRKRKATNENYRAMHNKAVRKAMEKSQSQSREKAVAHGNPPTDKELNYMRELFAQKKTYAEVAEAVGRTYYAVTNMVHRFNLKTPITPTGSES